VKPARVTSSFAGRLSFSSEELGLPREEFRRLQNERICEALNMLDRAMTTWSSDAHTRQHEVER
jgi:hypothetical protein